MVNMVFLPLLKEECKKQREWMEKRKKRGGEEAEGRKKGKALGSNSVGSDLQKQRLWPPKRAPRARATDDLPAAGLADCFHPDPALGLSRVLLQEYPSLEGTDREPSSELPQPPSLFS